jgi:hypothetical protein
LNIIFSQKRCFIPSYGILNAGVKQGFTVGKLKSLNKKYLRRLFLFFDYLALCCRAVFKLRLHNVSRRIFCEFFLTSDDSVIKVIPYCIGAVGAMGVFCQHLLTLFALEQFMWLLRWEHLVSSLLELELSG